jgi:XTP/dITP diphosphohydrolase
MSSASSIVLASNNRGKLAEFAQLLAPYKIIVHAQSEFIGEGAEETGTSFVENALLKARHASRAAGMPAIADDSGIEVDALGWAPGVYSARYAGGNASDADNNRKLLENLTNVPDSLRTARFRCVLAYVRTAEDPAPIGAEGVWEGRVLRAPRGAGGFGYDPLFEIVSDSNANKPLSVAELDSGTKNLMSHRGMALRELIRLMICSGEISR